jgi:hypothetical protein
MQTITISLPRPHAAQRTVLTEARRFNAVCCGRRFGKTTLGVDRILEPALAGEPVGWFAPTYRILIPSWRHLRSLLQPITARRNDAEQRIELVTGGVVEMWSLTDPDGARGRAYARIVIDEAARVVHLERAWNEVIRPTLTDYQGDAWFLSTPRGLNFFHTIWQRGQDPASTEWASWQMPTTANPHIVPAEVAAAQRELPAIVFAQEYLAQFIPDAAGVLRRVREAAIAEPQEKPIEGHAYLVSVDWGKHQDWTVLAVWDATLGELVYLDRFQQIDYTLQLGRLQAVCTRFDPFALVPERNSVGDVLIERIAREPWCPPASLPFTTTNASKALAVESFALALEQGTVRIIDDPVLVGELQAFAATRLPSGMLRYSAPEGAHDDCVIACVIGHHALSGGFGGEDVMVYDDPVSISSV